MLQLASFLRLIPNLVGVPHTVEMKKGKKYKNYFYFFQKKLSSFYKEWKNRTLKSRALKKELRSRSPETKIFFPQSRTLKNTCY